MRLQNEERGRFLTRQMEESCPSGTMDKISD